ncbi:MAG: redoxin domain-containing protein [Spirochaetes bacterium]|jgi:thiol-disulfide isomerase/thioredoxin|nr:redoxin domain-containing protein [Spirochaetota bacterium]
MLFLFPFVINSHDGDLEAMREAPRKQRLHDLAVLTITTAAVLFLTAACATSAPGAPGGGAPTPLRGDDRHADPWLAQSYAGVTPAKPLPTDLEWLNVEYPLTIEQLRGKIVLIDFWTYGCINCIHNIPELIELQEKYADTLVVIGVHSAKFENEGRSENLRRIISRYEIPYPVINDRNRNMMDRWNVRAWPTLFLIDPAGNVAGRETGEGFYEKFNRAILSLIQEFDEEGRLDRGEVEFTVDRGGLPQTVLSFPSKVLGDLDNERLFVADTNNHRVLEVSSESGAVKRVIGGGSAGFTDGRFSDAQFNKPRGMALSTDGRTLYVADTANHSIRTIDLQTEEVDTLAGTGIKPYNYPPRPGPLPTKGLRSPWDLALRNTILYVAMAGSHQIWQIDIEEGVADYAAGTGREEVIDGPAFAARLAQPSGLTILGDHLYFADSESSFLRRLSLPARGGAEASGETRGAPFEGVVETVAGSGNGLFDYGDADGVGKEIKMQHPLGVAAGNGAIYIADTYNHKIKRFDPETRRVQTVFGGASGWADSESGGPNVRFFEPGGVDLDGQTLLVADTNNHTIRLIDLSTGTVDTLVVHSVPRSPEEVTALQLPAVRLAPGEATVRVDLRLPTGFKVNETAPSGVTLHELPSFLQAATREVSAPGQEFPVTFAVTAGEGAGSATLRLSLVYCREGNEGVCFFETVDLLVPVEVRDAAASSATLTHRVTHRELDAP